MFALVVRFDLHDEARAAEFDLLVEETGRGIAEHEPGTLVYATHRVTDAPLARVFYEVYRDREAFDAHECQPHTRHFLAERDKYVKTTRVEFMTPATAKGLPADG
ncbi:antibiotic biosynthesis monooxygenase [Amycolatopsis mongoliensis]|uniref:Antibiotic biosynthesis monooxygenase n=1 Tax=Amycolatopsis mongoliensis TaxID=715475 RepID=A0A9Y2JMH0_9PSEU|nr:antibiotic biosynthesis monooxygenase [Amycolatopsis sp. 4-36]WIY00097.1 antibiotic biosynthesis monooxygenase [Amycolatopsis sp. 4-36]